MILRAAYYMRDGRIISLPQPARHHDLIWYAVHILGYDTPIGGGSKDDPMKPQDIAGFTCKLEGQRHRQFICREPAKIVARDNNQLLDRASEQSELFSECVWEGRFDRDEWLSHNTWTETEDELPGKGVDVWYFEENVGVFSGKLLYIDAFGPCFGGKHGTIHATHWMPLSAFVPDSPWVPVYDEDTLIRTEKDLKKHLTSE